MGNNVYSNFESYIKNARNIFDIMAVAYKALYPFEPMVSIAQDSALCDIVSCFSEQRDLNQAFLELKEELLEWFYKYREMSENEIREKMFFLIRLIDGKCVWCEKSFLPDSYSWYFSLNHLFQEEICILPRAQNSAIELLCESMKVKTGYGFYGRNYSTTSDISGYLNNFLIYRRGRIKPCIIMPNYYDDIIREFEQKGNKLKVGIFPLSNINLRCIFRTKEEIVNKEGLFYIDSPMDEQERNLLERCKEALNMCRNQCVDIAVFPEMLFTNKNQNAIIDFIKESNNCEKGMRYPWFMWLGTAWAEKENKCIVIDQYGKIVFEQKKFVPYEYKKEVTGNVFKSNTKNGKGIKHAEKVVVREALAHEEDWTVNFLDLPGLLRIATAICRDISDNQLTAVLKELYSDMVVIPAFSETDRLTARNITPLALEKIISLVCNACSARCDISQKKFEVDDQMIGKEHIFSYLCLPAKHSNDNDADYHVAHYTSLCKECEKCCNGYIWEIDFNRCVVKNERCTAEVI